MVQLNFDKGFGRVVHGVLFRILGHVNVGCLLLEGVQMCYAECFARIIVNKRVSESVQVLSSLRQGCPLSPLLCALYLESFCLKLLFNKKIRGFRLLNSEVKALSYAEDMAGFCDDKESINDVVKDAFDFCKF